MSSGPGYRGDDFSAQFPGQLFELKGLEIFNLGWISELMQDFCLDIGHTLVPLLKARLSPNWIIPPDP
jgi:hypothetical protein